MIEQAITHQRRHHERRDRSVEQLVRDAHAILMNWGIEMSASKVSRLVRVFKHRVEHNGWAFFDFLANAAQLNEQQRREALLDPDLRRIFAYADPTGETAVRNVMREDP